MAVWLHTDDPSALLDHFRAAIDDGSIVTWDYDADGDFTHATPQWRRKAWMRPRLDRSALVLNILGNTTAAMTKEIYAIYHGRITESFLAHCDLMISEVVISAFAEAEDSI